jgi:hypothetical protein
MEAYHMSRCIHRVGTVLNGNGLPKVENDIEDALGRHRPQDCLDRLQAVYAVAIPDFHQLGLESGYIYRVDVGDHYQRHDACWIGKLREAHLKRKYSQFSETTIEGKLAKTWPDWTDDFVSDCCIKYWTGVASEEPLWELLSREAEIKAQLSATIVQARSTKGGWNPG